MFRRRRLAVIGSAIVVHALWLSDGATVAVEPALLVSAPATASAPDVAPAATAPPPPEPPVATTASQPPPTAPPVPAPTTTTTAAIPVVDLRARAHDALAASVPPAWRAAIPVELVLVGGSTSWAHSSGRIEVARAHVEGSWSHLLSVVAHEFGHQIAFRFGTRSFAGAPPAGWPGPDQGDPAEAWADCVAQAFTGIVDPSYDLAPCPQGTVEWTSAWLADTVG